MESGLPALVTLWHEVITRYNVLQEIRHFKIVRTAFSRVLFKKNLKEKFRINEEVQKS